VPRVPDERYDFRRSAVAGIDAHDRSAGNGIGSDFFAVLSLPFNVHAAQSSDVLHELPNQTLLSGRNDVVVRPFLLEQEPFGAYGIPRMTPVTTCLQIAQIQALLFACCDPRQAARDLASDECLAAHRRFMIEENGVAGKDAIGLAIVRGDPVGVGLGGTVRRAWPQGRRLVLGIFRRLTVHFRGRGLQETASILESQNSHGLEQTQGSDGVGVCRVFRRFERDGDVTLRRRVVDLVRLYRLDDPDEVHPVGQIAIMEYQA